MNFYYCGDFDPKLTQLLGGLLRARGHKFAVGPVPENMGAVDVIIVDDRHPRAEHLCQTFHQTNYLLVVVTEVGPTLGAEDAAVRAWHKLGANFCLRRLYDREGLGEYVEEMLELFGTITSPALVGETVS